MPILYGVGASPFVRKVRVFLAEKGVPYEREEIVPINVPPEYKKISPLGKIPAYRDGEVTLADSSVICAYLERVHPAPPLYPADPYPYARALWLEEWADTALAQVVGPGIFFQRIVAPRFFGRATDEEAVRKAVAEDLPPLLDYLEGALDGAAAVGGRFSIADIALGTQFVNLRHAGVAVDGARWPRLARYVAAVHERPSFRALIEEERASLGIAA
jgi:glutathione S-transferase